MHDVITNQITNYTKKGIRMMKIKSIIVIVEREESGVKYNKRFEFETLRKFENWIKYNKIKGKLN